jgi:peptidoglycan/xylan/chitin deacetylase (PgdA/CDA1 family)
MALYYAVWKELQALTEVERKKTIDDIIEWANYQPNPRLSHRPMTKEELPMLEASGWVKIGAHTVNHPLLFAHSIATQKQEIEESKAYLEQVLNHSVTTFAYPFGAYNRKTLPLVKEAGFSCACSTVEETVWQWCDRYQLPRFEVLDWDAQEFEQRLLNWLQNE